VGRSTHGLAVRCQTPELAAGSCVLAQLLAFETDPFALMLVVGAQRSRNHRHAAARADRRPVFLVHGASICGQADDATNGCRSSHAGRSEESLFRSAGNDGSGCITGRRHRHKVQCVRDLDVIRGERIREPLAPDVDAP
jgi:hypothetical protein